MKIEEAKDAIKVRSKAMTDINAINSFGHIPCQQAIPVNEVINIIDKIELAPPKPPVPQCAIDWVDNSREYDYEFDEWFEYNNQPREVYEWLNPENKRQADLNALALMTLIVNGPDAVEVEKEKLYNVSVLGCTLFKMTSDNHVRYKLIGENETLSEPVLSLCKFEANLTEREIKQADERLWQFAKSAF